MHAAETTASFQNSSNFSQTSPDDYFCTSRPIGPLMWTFYSVFFCVAGLPPSAIVMWELYKRQNFSNNFFVFNLTVIDLIYLINLPLGISNFLFWHNDKFNWICNFIYSLTVSGRPLFMACVCGEYYFAVVHPIIYRTSKRTVMIRKAIALMIWLFIICFGYIMASDSSLYSTVLGCSPLFIALPVIGFCDVCVFWALRKKDPSGKTTVHLQKRRALRTIISSFVMTFIVYLPPAVIFSMGQYTHLSYETYNCLLIFVAVFFTASGCVIMPVLYLESVGQLNVTKIVQKLKSFLC